MKNILIITGPTGVGKTAVSVKAANILGCEIISCDSMQIYKGMDIGTAKIKKDEMNNIPHHMIDFVDPKDEFSVADFKSTAETIIEGIISRKKIPMLVGGTGLYINAFVFERNHGEIPRDEAFRKKMNALDKDVLYDKLMEKDPDAEKIYHKNETKRIIRALEIIHHGGGLPSELRENLYRRSNEYNPLVIFISREREKLYEIIDNRVDKMIEQGLPKEAESFYKRGYSENMQSMKGIGYQEFFRFFRGEISFDEAVNLIKQHSRNYSKRQFTWFKKIPNLITLSADNLNVNELAKEVVRLWRSYEK